ncbi:hypothetical protein PVK06_030529 [Gossypium arboreum]|uniref:Retrotransposon gag domain-containing protein n=1 Tax=Gossypium arboreum TaxID=29729 RepID=A0ABR0NNI5_GOSAR|nr:hypothetical protein PVK06_030529 [Gossypium arboreum]
MSKEEFEQIWARKSLREMLSAVEVRVGKLEESMEDVKESDNARGENIEDMKEQFRDFVTTCLTSQRDHVQELLDSQRKKLTEMNNALEAMVKALKEETMATTLTLSTRIEELERKLALCRVAVEEGVSSAALSSECVPEPKKFVGTRSAGDVDNFLWRMENYFRAKGIVDDADKVQTASLFLIDIAVLWWRGRTTDKRQCEIGTWEKFQCELKGQFYPEFAEEEARAKLQGITQRGTVGEYVREFKELMLQVSNVTEREAMLAFQEGLKPWVRQEVEQKGVQKLSEAMKVAVSVVKLGLGKDKLGSSKSEERGVCEEDHEEDTDEHGNDNGDNCGNGKPRVGKKKPKKKRDKLKCFLCDGPHMLKKCPMKPALRKKPVGKALGLGLSTTSLEAKEAECEKKLVECFLCHGLHRLRKCPRKSVIDGNDRAGTEPKKLGSSKGKVEAKRAKRSKSVIEGNDGADKEPKKLGSSKGKAEAKRAKRSKKKRVKCFLCRGPHELRNCPKQVVVKGKATSEHRESSEGLPPKGEVSLSSNLEEEVAMKIVKLGIMRLESSEASELAESSTRLPPMGEVGGASDFKEKEVMHVGQLTLVNAKVHSKHSDSVLHSNLCTWQERRGPFEVLEQGGRETVGKAKPSVVNHEDSVRGKLECGQESDITPCRRDVQTSRTARVRKRRKPRQKSQRKERAKTTSGVQGESSQCHSKVATRTLREWVGENVTGQSSKPVTIEPNASDGGLLLRWGSFGPRILIRVKADLGEFGRANHLRQHGLRDERSSPVTLATTLPISLAIPSSLFSLKALTTDKLSYSKIILRYPNN